MAYKGQRKFFDVMWKNPGKFGRKWYHVGVLVEQEDGKISFALNANCPWQYLVLCIAQPYRAWCQVFRREDGAGEYDEDVNPNEEPDPQ